MNREDFVEYLDQSLRRFNLFWSADENDGERLTNSEWMQRFLDWMEWKTEVHDLYWMSPEESKDCIE